MFIKQSNVICLIQPINVLVQGFDQIYSGARFSNGYQFSRPTWKTDTALDIACVTAILFLFASMYISCP